MTKIAFIGTGNMGRPMALNLLKAGFAVTAFDVVAESLAKVTSAGAVAATSAAGTFRNGETMTTTIRRSDTGRAHPTGARAGVLDLMQAKDQSFFVEELQRAIPLHVHRVSEIAFDGWKHGDDRTALMVVGSIVDLLADYKFRHRDLLGCRSQDDRCGRS